MELNFTEKGKADLEGLATPVAERVNNKLLWLAEHFAMVPLEALKGEWQGAYKLRVGDYRVLYTVEEDKGEIVVHLVRHRSEVYKAR